MTSGPVAFLVFSLFATLVCPDASRPQSQKDKQEALVVGIIGEWKSDAKPNDLKFLQAIEVGDGVCAYGTDGYLAVQFGDKVTPFVCDRQTDGVCNQINAPKREKASAWDKPFVCARHIARPPDSGLWEAFTAAVVPLFRRSPERFVAPVSRGLEAEISDAVVQLRGGSVDFAGAFGDLNAGSYTVRLDPLDGASRAPASAAVSWKGGGTAVATVAGLTPGLYRIVLLEANGTPRGQDAWVLVCSPERFEKRSHEFSKAVEAAKTWPPEVDARAPRAVLRAYLQALSSEPGAAK
jgi:hypothetical protein